MMNDQNLTEREMKIIEVLFLNLCAQTSARITNKGMALTPLEKVEEATIFHYQFAWQSAIERAQYEEIVEGIKRQIGNALKMCGLPEANIHFTENAYLNQ
ncbi:hypothetical protein OEV98_05875 [Caldibacillus lycopersici]|uniref:Uncharacterized protein n=1 Tax=Perspicuibacillus lycopersici TaxID=1325689 RepID=A0AAE3LMS5_9BACI|nr:hypothetical protein [Perspicuibacillus lycopersici]MCU9613077.1 hypothetical protein [Perspicuibacillus lycopersici]